MKKTFAQFLFTFFLVGLCFVSFSSAQVNKDSELFKTLLERDQLLFGEGFNQCKMERFEELLNEDMEFYHDITGVMKSKSDFVNNFKNGPCKTGKPEVQRALVKESLQVFELKNQGKLYGAIQKGEHTFGGQGIAKFTHLWLLVDSKWKLSRVYSYEHRPLKKK